MNKILLSCLCLISFQIIQSQTISYVGGAETVTYEKAEIKPEYLGGYNAFVRYVADNYKAPDVEGLAGVVKVTFVIEVNGRVTNIKVTQDLGSGSGDEAIRVLKLCPIWSPGEIEGERVRVKMELPITIRN